jgi:hypothetical protein
MAALGMPEPGAASGMEAAIAQDPAPTQETLRAYLGLIGGPDVDVDSLLGTNKNAPHVQSREHGTDGFVHALMSDGSTRKTDIKFDSSVMLVQDQDPNSATKGQYIPISKWSSGHQGQDPPEDWPRKTVQAIDAPLGTLPGEEGTTPAPAATTPAGTLDREALHQAQMKQESAGDPNAVSPMGAFGPMQLMPETAAVLEERAGLVPGASKDPAINERLGKQHMDELLTKYNGDQEMALIAYNRGEPNADAWAKGDPAKGIAPRDRSLLPAETQGYVQKILGGAQPAQGAQGAQPAAPARAATPFRTLTQAEIAGETERQKSLAKREMADTDAETQALIESAKTTGIELSKAQVAKYTGSKAARSKFDTVMGQSNIALDRLVSADGQMHPGLKGLTPETITGWFDPDKKWQRNALAKLNPKAAEALAYIEEIAGGNFLHGFNTIAGMGAGSIDRNEGIQLQKAIGNLSLARSPEAIAQSLMDIKAGRERAKEALDAAIAEGPFAQPLRPKAGGAGKPRTLEQMRADAKRLRGG